MTSRTGSLEDAIAAMRAAARDPAPNQVAASAGLPAAAPAPVDPPAPIAAAPAAAAPAVAPANAPAAAPPRPSAWPARGRALLSLLLCIGRGIAWIWSHPKVRLVLIGVTLVLAGGVVFTSSVWTLPLVIGGALMLLIAWVGSRLDGRFAVDWGESGTQLEFRAKIKSPSHPRALKPAQPPQPEPADAEVVESDGQTVEVDLEELHALIAATEAAA